MLERWSEKGLEVKKIKIKNSKMGDLRQQMQNFAFREPEVKYLGQRVSPLSQQFFITPSPSFRFSLVTFTSVLRGVPLKLNGNDNANSVIGIHIIYEIDIPTKG